MLPAACLGYQEHQAFLCFSGACLPACSMTWMEEGQVRLHLPLPVFHSCTSDISVLHLLAAACNQDSSPSRLRRTGKQMWLTEAAGRLMVQLLLYIRHSPYLHSVRWLPWRGSTQIVPVCMGCHSYLSVHLHACTDTCCVLIKQQALHIHFVHTQMLKYTDNSISLGIVIKRSCAFKDSKCVF